MNRRLIEEDDSKLLADLPPQDVLADIAAGLGDLKHSRCVDGSVVLAELDKTSADYLAKRRAE